MVQFILRVLSVDKDIYDDIKFRLIQGILTAAVVLFPLCLIRDMSGFRYVSFASILALFYTGIVLLIELPGYIQKNYSEENCKLAIIDIDIFPNAAKTFFAYTC